MRHLLSIFVGPLPANFYSNASSVVDVANARFGLQEGVFLVGQVIGAFYDDVSVVPTGVHIAFANLVFMQDVAAMPRLDNQFIF